MILIIEGDKARMLAKGLTYKQDSKYESWYKVMDVYRYPNGSIDALLQNVESGWTFTAHGIHFNGDKIYWAYSSGGYFAEVN